MPWKPEYAARRRAKYQSDAAERERRKSQGRSATQNVEYMRGYYAGNKTRWKRSPEQQAEINKRKRERYATDESYREEAKRQARKRPAESRRAGRLKATYAMDAADYDALAGRQNGRCGICGDQPRGRLFVDHCHESGKVRGLLCSPCNTGLGHFKDDVERLARAMVYLVQSKQ